MASISPPPFPSTTRNFDPTPHKLTYATPKFSTTSQLNHRSTYSSTLFSQSLSTVFNSTTICRCQKNNDEGNNGSPSRWDSAFQENIRNVVKWFNDNIAGNRENQLENAKPNTDDGYGDGDGNGDEDWNWERWKKHFAEVDKQEIVVSVLKSQLQSAVVKEDYEEAARIKVAIAAAAANDTVGRVMSDLNKAIKEERYNDAAIVRDNASAGLVGWWAGFSDDNEDPYGRIIQISAEHGRYLARSYTPSQLAKAGDGSPLFEVFITVNEKGEYKHQAVYLKENEGSGDFPLTSFTSSNLISSMNPLDFTGDKVDQVAKNGEDTDDVEETDDGEEFGFEDILRAMIPGAKDVKIKLMNVTSNGQIDRNLISKVIEQIMEEEEEEDDDDDDDDDDDEDEEEEEEEEKEEEEEENDTELEGIDEVKLQFDIDYNVGNRIIDGEGNNQIAVKIVVGDSVQEVSSDKSSKDIIRVPAKLEKKNRSSFTFLIDKKNQQDSLGNTESLRQSDGGIQGSRSTDNVILDLATSIGRGEIPKKVLDNVGQLINLTINQGQRRQSLSGSTMFNRIEIPGTGDPLNGLYVGAHGIYTSEIVQLKRKFGQWKEDDNMKDFTNLEFYEYVEAVKITGDLRIPAGQVAFRAKVGIKYQLPLRGLPENFGVIARYPGQARLAESGFQNPRWVDGELLILDGKLLNGGPHVGFVYLEPENHLLVFYNQLRLQE